MTLVTGDVSVQTEQVMKNLAAVLAAAGFGFDRVVKTTCFLADLNDFAAFNAVYGRFLGVEPASALHSPGGEAAVGLVGSRSSVLPWSRSVYWPAGIAPKATAPGALSKSLASLSHTSVTGTLAASVSVKQPPPIGLQYGTRLTTEERTPVSTGCSAVQLAGALRGAPWLLLTPA